MSVEVINFGCRLNIAEGEAIRAAAGDQDDLIVINSCAVTAEASRQARQAVRRAARRRPDARIIVTGCAAQIDPTGRLQFLIGHGERWRHIGRAGAARLAAPTVGPASRAGPERCATLICLWI